MAFSIRLKNTESFLCVLQGSTTLGFGLLGFGLPLGLGLVAGVAHGDILTDVLSH